MRKDPRDSFLKYVEERSINERDALIMCMKWMSWDDVRGMCCANEIPMNDNGEIDFGDDDEGVNK